MSCSLGHWRWKGLLGSLPAPGSKSHGGCRQKVQGWLWESCLLPLCFWTQGNHLLNCLGEAGAAELSWVQLGHSLGTSRDQLGVGTLWGLRWGTGHALWRGQDGLERGSERLLWVLVGHLCSLLCFYWKILSRALQVITNLSLHPSSLLKDNYFWIWHSVVTVLLGNLQII